MVGLEALRKSDLFEGLSDDELAAIAKMAREETYDTGATIFRENEVAKNLYIVREAPSRGPDRHRPREADGHRHGEPQRLVWLVRDGPPYTSPARRRRWSAHV